MESIAAMMALNNQCEHLESDTNSGSVRVVSGSGFRYVVPFPWRLHQMLEITEASGVKAIVSWLPDGKHFKVHDIKAFLEEIVPQFFKQKSYKSFQRQLLIYGFSRVLKGPSRGAYYHPKFIKKDRKLTHDIVRIKAPQRKQSTHAKEKELNDDMQVISSDNHSMSSEPASVIAAARSSSTPAPRDDTNMWLIGVGVAFSDLDPNSIDMQGLRNVQLRSSSLSTSLLNCAEEISSLFGESSQKKCVPSVSVPLSLLGQSSSRHEEAFFSTNFPSGEETSNQSQLKSQGAIPSDTPSNVTLMTNATNFNQPVALSNAFSPSLNIQPLDSQEAQTDEFLSITGQWGGNKSNIQNEASGGWF